MVDKTAIINNDRHRYTLPLLMVGLVIAMLPMMLFREFTPANELRYLSIADEAIRNGQWWAFTNHGIPYADKPPLYIWCVMLGKLLFGKHLMWFLSLFSIIPACVTALIMDRWTRKELAPNFQTSGTLMLFSCGLFAGMIFTLRMDMMMTMFIVLALYQFRRLETSESKPTLSKRLLFALWIFLGVFSKGPMGILIPFTATTVWLLISKKRRLWTRAWGWPTWTLLLALCAGWFGMVYAGGGSEYLDNLLVKQTVGRAVNSFHHKGPVWYYLVSLTYTLLPWTFIIFGALIYGLRRWKTGLTDTGHYFLTVILSSFVLLSLISSKLQVYMLPAYPFMAYLGIMVCSRHSRSSLTALGVFIPSILLAIAGLAAVAFILTQPDVTHGWWWLHSASVVLLIGTTLTFYRLYVVSNLSQAISILSATVLALIFVAGFASRDFKGDLGYGELAMTAANIHHKHPDARLMTWRINRTENMDVYLGTDKEFDIVEPSDTTDAMPLSKLPAIVMTKKKYRQEVPYVVREIPVGHKYIVLECDTIKQEKR